jgi:DsbC/DsbD-like thiol-disulfide interchange protein
MKRSYKSPVLEIVEVKSDGVCQGAVITQSPDSDDFAKPNENEVEQDDEAELAVPIKDKWDDLSEKKNGK